MDKTFEQEELKAQLKEKASGNFEPQMSKAAQEWHDHYMDYGTELKKQIRRFPSGAVRSDDTGRPRPDLISGLALEALGYHLGGNVNDFGAENYLLGIPEAECEASNMRHYCDYKRAKIKGDEDQQYHEAVAMLFNQMALVHTMCMKREGLYNEVYKKTELI